jgi:Right handed beta helix region
METRCSPASCKLHVLIALTAWVVIAAAPTRAATGTTWWVTNKGLDSASCGTRSKPCRSISAAIEKASDGDVVEVGAGLYGDLNGDGAFTAPGEEHFNEGEGCIICISKAIRLLSLHGAEKTIIDAGNSGRVGDVVNFTTGGVTLGDIDRGFTITGGRNGVHVEPPASGVKIIGNIARGNETGFLVEILDENTPPFPVPVTQYTLRGNVATGNNRGFTVSHDETNDIPVRVSMTGNTASGNTVTTVNGAQLPAIGFDLRGRGFELQLIGNVVANNQGIGIDIEGEGYQIRNNSVLGNAAEGILINGRSRPAAGNIQITGNTIVGNIGAGIILLAGPTGNVIHGNNIWGNWGAGSIPAAPPLGGFLNCGVVNDGGGERPPATDATNNFWGSATGPGPDPADNAGKGCDFNGGVTIVKPFATTEFAIDP